jgi:wyosine [tRNA(Phe)-imidazoG37] synthetase (radical SAM superfamily)
MLVGSLSEPTLYPYIFELIKYLKSRKIKIELCTNGDTHNPEWWYKLGKLFDLNDSVYFTICGST